LLIVEVAETSLRYDRTTKAGLYARAGIADYWIINLKDRQLEVHRDPIKNASKPFGYDYRTRTVLKGRDNVSPLAAPHSKIEVADLLP
jgi:Uma2 family endonuclease